MATFWNKSAQTADIYIYGDITSYAWEDTDTTAKNFVDDLNSYNGKPVTIHVNSGGGDVFTALAIYNALKSYKGGVTITIDGLAASAASLIAIAGKPTRMASNALIMIHAPAVGLYSYYDAAALAKVMASLEAVHGSLVETYATRIDAKDAEKLIATETWLNAKDALAMGLVDEITDEVPLQVDAAQRTMFVNSLTIDMNKYDGEKLRRALGGNYMAKKTENPEVVTEQVAAPVAPAVGTTFELKAEADIFNKAQQPAIDVTAILNKERQRVRELRALKGDNASVNAFIDVAIDDGKTVEEIRPYVTALKNVQSTQNAVDKIAAVVRDQMMSGAEGVSGGQTAPDPKEIQAKKIAEFANGMI